MSLLCLAINRTPLGVRPFNYSYIISTESDATSLAMCKISHEKMESYNWNYLDQHVCGHSDFEQYQEVSHALFL